MIGCITFTGSGNVRKGEETRQEIIRKAAPIFNRKGYSGAALSDLMQATGLEKGGSTGTLRASRSLLSMPSPTLGKFHLTRASREQGRSRIL